MSEVPEPTMDGLDASIAEFAASHLAAIPDRGDFSRSDWRKLAEFGITGLTVPAEYGGLGLGPSAFARAMEEMGAAGAHSGLMFSLAAQVCAVQHPLMKFGTAEQKERYLPRLCDGSAIAAFATTEPSAGSDAFSLQATASKHGATWLLSGTKAFITNAPIADVFLVATRLHDSQDFRSLCMFMVPKESPGISVTPIKDMPELSGHSLGAVYLDSCEVPETAMLGRAGQGMAVFNVAMNCERALIMAGPVGAMRRQLRTSIDFAKHRVQFGRPIHEFQGVAHRIADMKVRLETARLMTHQAAAELETGVAGAAVTAAIAKLYTSEAYLQSTLDAIQIQGAVGFGTHAGLIGSVHEALASRFYSGTSEMLRNYISSMAGA